MTILWDLFNKSGHTTLAWYKTERAAFSIRIREGTPNLSEARRSSFLDSEGEAIKDG
jgi:hypothetical protein